MSDPCVPTCRGLTLEQELEQARACCEANEPLIQQLELGALAAAPEFASWADPNQWDEFDEISLSGQGGDPPDNNVILTTDDGIGVATNDGGSHSNDRRLYQFEGVTLDDVEVRVTFTLSSNSAQLGLAGRSSPNVAVVGWSNIIGGGSSAALHGIWEYAGNALLDTNQMEFTPLSLYPILNAEGDGSTVTVRTRTPHLLRGGGNEFVQVNNIGGISGDVIANPTEPDVFTFSDGAVFSTTDGTWGKVNESTPLPRWRHMALRVIDDYMIVKQWVLLEPEPNWADPLRTETSFFPDTLDASGDPPPADGHTGILINHLGDSMPPRDIRVRDYEVRSL